MNRKRLWNLRLYLSLLMSVSLGLAAVTWFISPVVFCVALPVTAVVCGLCIWQLVYMQRQIHNLFDKVMDQLDAGQRHYLHDFPLPVVIVTGEREVVWYSESFREKVIPGDDLYGINLDRITKEKLPGLRHQPGGKRRNTHYPLFCGHHPAAEGSFPLSEDPAFGDAHHAG